MLRGGGAKTRTSSVVRISPNRKIAAYINRISILILVHYKAHNSLVLVWLNLFLFGYVKLAENEEIRKRCSNQLI